VASSSWIEPGYCRVALPVAKPEGRRGKGA